MIQYIWFKICTKLKGCAIRDSKIDSDAKIEAGTTFVGSQIGKFSYCGYDCYIINTSIGAFCSISDNVSIGGGNHPLDWVSTSPAFYKGRDSISKRLAKLEYDTKDAETVIGNDVWIGRGAYLKAGIKVGDGAVIGMGSVVTKDVESYAVVAGNPARIIKRRFSDDEIVKLQEIKWWNWSEETLSQNSHKMNSIVRFFEDEN